MKDVLGLALNMKKCALGQLSGRIVSGKPKESDIAIILIYAPTV